jgi:hypothetical protein
VLDAVDTLRNRASSLGYNNAAQLEFNATRGKEIAARCDGSDRIA